MKLTPFLTAGVVLSLGTLPAAYGLEFQPDPDPFTEQATSKVGSGSDQESTKMKRNPAKDHTADHDAQVTIGGARPVVSGEIRNMEGVYYFIQDDETGNEVRLLVNKDANLDCSGHRTRQLGQPPRLSQMSNSQENSMPLRPKNRDKSRTKRP